MDPNYAKAYNSRGTAYNFKGEHNRAIEDFSKVIALDPNDAYAAYTNRGLAYYRKGQHDRAIKDYNKAIALAPNFAHVYYNRGLAYREKGDIGRAISDFQKVCDMGIEEGCKELQTVLRNL